MSVFSTAATAARAVLYATGGETVTYARAAASVALTGIIERESVDVVDDDNVMARAVRADLYVQKAALILSGSAATPARGDTVTDADGNLYDVPEPAEDLRESGEWRIPLHQVDA